MNPAIQECDSASAASARELRKDSLRVAASPPLSIGSTRRRLLRGVAWNTLGSAFAQGGSFAGAIVVARILGKHAFGQFALIQSSVVALSVLAALGLGITATKFVSEYRTSDPLKVGRILGLSSLVAWVAAAAFSIGLLIAAPSFAGGLAPAVRLSTLYVLFITANAYQVGALAGFEAFRSVARIGAIYGFASVLFSWCMAVWWGLPGAVLAQGAGAILLWSLYHVALRNECRSRNIAISYRHAWRQHGILFRFSIPAAASGMVGVVAAWASNALLVRNAGFGELALFSAVNSMRSMVLFLPALIARVTAPLLNHMKASGDETGYRNTFRATVAGNASIALILAAVLSLAGTRILRLFGKDFNGSTALVLLLLGSVVLEVVANNLFQALFTAGKLWRNLAIVCAWTVILAGCAALVTPRYGAVGLAFSYLAAWSVSAFLYWRQA